MAGSFAALFFLAVMQVWISRELLQYAQVQGLDTYSEESEAFREMKVEPKQLEEIAAAASEHGISFSQYLAAVMALERFSLAGKQVPDDGKILRVRKILLERKQEPYQRLSDAYEKIFEDLACFPVPKTSREGSKQQIFFEDGYGEARGYGGKRSHEGIDLFGGKTEEGFYLVQSVTDGVVEKVGWLPLGGYRIGVRSIRGGYFYYAHLSSYAKEYREGDRVSAGEILGYMGSTGYGPEGTRGKFPVHLHFGIYIQTPHHQELSINPYPILKLLTKKIQEYPY